MRKTRVAGFFVPQTRNSGFWEAQNAEPGVWGCPPNTEFGDWECAKTGIRGFDMCNRRNSGVGRVWECVKHGIRVLEGCIHSQTRTSSFRMWKIPPKDVRLLSLTIETTVSSAVRWSFPEIPRTPRASKIPITDTGSRGIPFCGNRSRKIGGSSNEKSGNWRCGRRKSGN